MMSRLAWEITFGGACWIAAGIIAAACWAAFKREERRRQERVELKARAAKIVAALRVSVDFSMWEDELGRQRPVYDWEVDGL